MIETTRICSARFPRGTLRKAALGTASVVLLLANGCTSSSHSTGPSSEATGSASHAKQSPTAAPSGAAAVRDEICGGIDSEASKFTGFLIDAAKRRHLPSPKPSPCSPELTSGAVFATFGKARVPALSVSVLAKSYGHDCGFGALGAKPTRTRLGGGVDGVFVTPPRRAELWICWPRQSAQIVLLAVGVPKLPTSAFQPQALEFARFVAAHI